MGSLSPDERVFRQHLTSAPFQEGVARRRWWIVGDIAWPVVLVAVAAGPRDNAPSEYLLRFDLTGYPEMAPKVTPWNLTTGEVLEEKVRPKGERVGNVFRSDLDGGTFLYAPFDRVALDRYHADWRRRYPQQAWNGGRDLAWVLRILHEMLNNDDYTGT